jgi:hypothetical protein
MTLQEQLQNVNHYAVVSQPVTPFVNERTRRKSAVFPDGIAFFSDIKDVFLWLERKMSGFSLSSPYNYQFEQQQTILEMRKRMWMKVFRYLNSNKWPHDSHDRHLPDL